MIAWVLFALFLAGCGGSAPKPAAPPAEAPRTMTLIGPRGEADAVPAEFTWAAFPGASEYRVKIEDEDAVWPLIVKTVKTTGLTLTEKERAAITRGRIHHWSVEARDARGATIATGGARFRVALPGERPS